MIYSLDLKDEEQFRNLVQQLGFKIVDEYSGEVTVGKGYKSRVITLEKVGNAEGDVSSVVEKMDRQTLEGLKFTNTNTHIKDTRKIFEQFTLAGKTYEVEFNSEDGEIYEEEKEVLTAGEALKGEFKGIENIPREQVLDGNFVRLFDGRRYILFKKLQKGRSVVVVK